MQLRNPQNEVEKHASNLLGLGKMDATTKKPNCSVGSCTNSAIAALAQQNLCLNHFFERCYEQLERVDPRGRRDQADLTDLASRRALAEECSHRALDVSLGAAALTNLDRARLLDILLWSGELSLMLCGPQSKFADPANFDKVHNAAHPAASNS
jgi:adenine-specific DNA glycosylase